jgi:cytochrome c oxidase subunit 2
LGDETGSVHRVTFTPEQAGDFVADCGRFCGSGHKTMNMIVHAVKK